MSGLWQFWIDRGGTFTDIVARHPDGTLSTSKLLSENPERYKDAAIAGIKQALGVAFDAPVPPGLVEAVKMGTTVATNALLERAGERVLLVVGRGFADALRIGNQARPRLFDLKITRPTLLYEKVVEIGGRVDVHGTELETLDEDAAIAAFAAARLEGISAVAIVLMHAWKYPAHEQRLAVLAKQGGFTQISTSHATSPMLRLVPRGDTTVVDAYLSPILRRYVDQVAAELSGVKLYFMQSNGGLTEASAFQGKDAILSGPAGGIVGAARTAEMAGFDHVIGFDMGGTSTDVALYAGRFERAFETEVAGVRMRAPMMAINTVAAGGGSILHFDGARYRVGPDSAGAKPGPASYRRGGPLAVTDANVMVGKIQPRHFPAIFGPLGDAPLDGETVAAKFQALAQDIEDATGLAQDPRAVAEGFLRIAVANMANAIKQVSVQKGHDATKFALACFGGAGGQHACMVADELGMQTVFIHPYAGVLSAYGMGLADQSVMREQAVESPLVSAALGGLDMLAERLSAEAVAQLQSQGAKAETISVKRRLHVRYAGTEAALDVELGAFDDMVRDFTDAHRASFGFATPGRALIAEAVSIEAIAAGERVHEASLAPRTAGQPSAIDTVEMWSNGSAHATPVYDRTSLLAHDRITGPALIREANATTVVEPGWTAEVTEKDHMLLRRTEALPLRAAAGTDRADPVLLELFNNLFMNVAEQTGAVLQNTSQSVNIKERLDFSCAIFDGSGALVANAPHVPVHLGAMGESVRTVIRKRGATLRPGDVVALNNPADGGTHLPDITVITPVFDEAGTEIRFFVGSRGHHADIGGLTPGSTPPNSRTIEDEGVVIDDFLLVERGQFREAPFRELLASARYPARSPDVNVADIKAQVAANEKGVQELGRVAAQHGWEVVRAYMRHVMDNAEESVRRVLEKLSDGEFHYVMDDGSPLHVKVSVDRQNRSARVDFTGTGPQRADNFNAPRAVANAVVLYVFRCLVGTDIPLNDGCLKPIEIVIPPGTFLSPLPGAAVVAGNTEVSQATCNALFGALGAMACSQATMNNFLFGDATRQYYETICGGTGAGPGFDGTSAIQTHMTNTRMTDPEVLELRYPVIQEEFAIRRGSGGAGQWRGGDGSVRRLRFLEPMTAVIVASRRAIAPFGLAGGEDGAAGRQWVERRDGRIDELTGTDRVELEAGDAFVIETPGGGGMRLLRTLSILVTLLLAIAVAAVWLVPPMLDWNRYRADIAALVSGNLGRAVDIQGPISLSLLPEPVLTAGKVTVAEDHDGVTMAVSEMRVRLALMPLLGGRVDAQELVLRGLDMRLPWPLRQDRLVLQAPTWLSSISARVENGRLSVGSVTMTGIDATLGLLPDTGSYALAGTAQISGLSWHLTSRLTRTGGDGAAGLDMSLDGQGPVQGLGAMFSGQIAADGSVAGRISGRGPDLSRLLAAPSVPFKADGRLSIAAGLAVADELTAEIAGSPARGAVALRLEPETRLDVSITASRLDLDAWLPALLRSAGKQIVASIPTGIDLSAEAATLAGGTLRGLRGRFEVDPSLVTLDDVAAVLPGDAQISLSGQVRRVNLLTASASQRPEIGLHFEGTGALVAANLRTTLAWIEQAGIAPLASLPNDVLRNADLRAAITADTNPSGSATPSSAPQVVLTDLNGMIDQSHVQGSLTIRPGNRLGLGGALNLDRLAIDPWLPGAALSMTNVPSRMGRFDLDLQLRAEQASYRDQILQPFLLDTALEAGKLTLRRLEAQSAGARLVTSGVINDQGRIADGRLDLAAAPDTAGQVISGFLPALAPTLQLLPRGALTLSVLAAGPPEALALRSVLDLGDLHIEAQPGFDLPGQKWSGALSLRHPGAPRLLDMLGLGGTAAWLGDGSLSWTGNFAGSGPLLAPTKIASDEFDVSAGRLRANGALVWDRSAGPPRLTGRITAETLPLPLPYPRAPDALPVAALAGWQASVRIEAGQVLAGLSPFLQKLSTTLSLANGTLRLDTLSARLEGGVLSGSVSMDAGASPPRLESELALAGATPPGAIFDLPFDLAGGSVNAHAKLSATGYSAAALLSTLDGTLQISVQDGVLSGVDLTRMGAKLADADLLAAFAGGTTAFSQFDVSANLHNGAALIAGAPFTAIGGKGSLQGLLDIAGQTAELRLAIRPAVPDAPEIALRVSGPLAAPNRTPEIADAQKWRLEHP
eukprot:gene10907-10989_t